MLCTLSNIDCAQNYLSHFALEYDPQFKSPLDLEIGKKAFSWNENGNLFLHCLPDL